MRIESINIIAFGKLKNCKTEFSDGFNVVLGDNEDGKTTIMEFIKMMFYGSKSRVSGISGNPRKKYLPWDGSPMAGSIEFSHNNKRYRIEREFGASNATDRIMLFDVDLGTYENFTGNREIGKEFFGISCAAFEKSAFIGNDIKPADNSEADGEINSKLSNITSSGDEDFSYEKILKRITDAKEDIISKSGKKGLYPTHKSQLEELEEQQTACVALNRRRDEISENIAALEGQALQLSKQKSDIFESIKDVERAEQRSRLIEFIKAAEEYELTEKALELNDQSIADRDFLETLNTKIKTVKELDLTETNRKADIKLLADDIIALEKEQSVDGNRDYLEKQKNDVYEKLREKNQKLAQIEATCAILNSKLENSKPRARLIFLIMGAAISLIAICGAIMANKPILLSGVVLGIILVISAFIFKSKPKTDSLDEQLSSAISQKQKILQDIEQLRLELLEKEGLLNRREVQASTAKELLAAKNTDMVKRRAALLEIQNKKADLLTDLIKFTSKFTAVSDISSAEQTAAHIAELLQKLENDRIRAQFAVKGTGCKSISEAKEKLSYIKNVDDKPMLNRDILNNKLRDATDRYNEVIKEITALKAELSTAFNTIRTPQEFDRDRNELIEKLADEKDFYECAEIAEKALGEAFSDIRKGFGSAIEQRALELFSKITNNRYNRVSISKNFDIAVSGNDTLSSRDIEYLSRGTHDQAYFALRLALSELLALDCGGLPVLLDDVFAQYDDTRTCEGIKFLEEYSRANQIIFFTCHGEIARIAGKQSVKIINIKQ